MSLGWTETHVTSVLVTRDADTDVGTHVKKGQRLEGCVHKPRDTKHCSQPHEAERKAWSRLSPEPSEGAWPYQPLDAGFQTSTLWENEVLLFKATHFVVLHYSSPRNCHSIKPMAWWGQSNSSGTFLKKWNLEMHPSAPLSFQSSACRSGVCGLIIKPTWPMCTGVHLPCLSPVLPVSKVATTWVSEMHAPLQPLLLVNSPARPAPGHKRLQKAHTPANGFWGFLFCLTLPQVVKCLPLCP